VKYAITQIYDGLDLLPHWLDHYAKLGIDEFLLAVGKKPSDSNADTTEAEVRRLCSAYPATVFPFSCSQFGGAHQVACTSK